MIEFLTATGRKLARTIPHGLSQAKLQFVEFAFDNELAQWTSPPQPVPAVLLTTTQLINSTAPPETTYTPPLAVTEFWIVMQDSRVSTEPRVT